MTAPSPTDQRRSIETVIVGFGKASLVFLAGALLVLLALFGRELLQVMGI